MSVRETRRTEIELPVAWPRLVAISGDHVAVVADDDKGRSTTFLVELGSRRITRVQDDGWQVQQVRMSATRLVWVEQDRQQTDALEPVAWRIVVLDLRSGRQQTFLASTERIALAPGILLAGNVLFHDTWHGFSRGTASLHAHDFGTGADREVIEDLPFHLTAFDGTHLLGGLTTRGTSAADTTSDLYVLDAHPPRALTRTGHVDGAAYLDHVLLWEDCVTSECAVVARAWPGGQPVQLLRAEMPMSALGRGFVVVRRSHAGSDRPAVLPLGSPTEVRELELPPDRTMVGPPQVSGRRVAWVTIDPDHPGRRAHLVVSMMAPGDHRGGRR